ncbi:alpha-isopropylmalate synthase regulatory domain-containing protein [Leucothrix pacifica]|nr:alpha-isopropylmalate synthase regulatory domain-containing protein [Leucothrix pacifica]
MAKQRQITLMDTTLRDGEQTQGVSFAPEEKVSMATALLGKLKVDRIEVASARVSKGEQEAVAKINAWAEKSGYANCVEVLGFVDHTRSVDWIVEAGGKVINLLTKGSEKHCREQLRISHEEHISRIKQTVEYAQSQGLLVNVYLEDWSNGYIDSPEYVFAHTEALRHLGIKHFMLPDTLGVMSPKEVFDSLTDMTSRFPELHFDFHPHNDYGLATANVMAAVEAGISSIHCTINCLGERAGNASLSQVAVVLRDKMDMKINIREDHIVDMSQMVASFSGKFVASNTPVLGADVFTQTAGIHADGDQKGGLYETKLNPERFARKREYALGKMSGKASLAKNLQSLGITLSEENQAKVLARVVELGDSKQKITTDDLPFIIADVITGSDYQHITLTGCSISSRLDEKTHVAIDVDIYGEPHTATGSGNGGFDAFTVAVDKILNLYQMSLPTLIDYEVHIPRGGQTSALTEAIVSWQLENGSKTSTRGVHANQVYAAINAALRMANMLLQTAKQKQIS